MTVAVDSRMLSWPPPSNHAPYYYPTVQSPYNAIPPKNAKELTREALFIVLEFLSSLLEREFGGMPIRLVAHGGACMLLHPGLHELAKRKSLYHSSRNENVPMRKTTRDVDYIRRSFVAEYVGKHKIVDADYKLQRCIRATAVRFGLGADWMNADADVALPMSTTSAGMPYDPIYHASLQPFNVRLHTVFTSKNQKLTIVNVTPAWAVALKLVRYAKWDPVDISLLLMNGTNLNKVHWTTRIIKKWLTDECSAMNYHNWDATRLMDMTGKIDHAVQMVTSIGTNLPPPTQDHSTSATASGLVGPLAGTPTHSARQSPTGGLPALNLLDSSSSHPSHSGSVPALQLLSSSSSSHSNSLRSVGPSASLDSGSSGWHPSITNNALALTLADDSHDFVRRKKRKESSRKSISASTSRRTSPWHSFQEMPISQQVDATDSLDLRGLGQALPVPTNQSDLPPFIPDFPADSSSSLSWKRTTKEKRRSSDKHVERRKEKQRRDQERDFLRRFKWEGRGSLLDDPREFVHRERDDSQSDTEEETSSSEEEEGNNRPLEYVPMPAPPVEVYTREWQEQRHREEKEWSERYDREQPQPPQPPQPLPPSDNRASLVGDNSHESERSINSHFRRPQHSQTWPVPSVRNPELMMSIYSPRDSPAIPATQATSPPSLKPDPAAQTHRRSFTSPVGL